MPESPDATAGRAAARAPQPSPNTESAMPVSFEEGLAEVTELVGRLESGSLGLSESIVAYERGVSLLRQLHEQLADVEERVRTLVRIDEQGRPILESTAGAAGGEADDTAPRRGPRPSSRAGRAKRLPGMDEDGGG